MTNQVFSLDPVAYQRHLIHGQDRDWAETNCYVDVLIELLHSWGFEPIAALAFTLGIDFEGDQWTFFKYPHTDLRDLFGLDIQELAVWRPLVSHIEEQVSLGRPVMVELDSYFLPDTEGTSYQREHTKSTVAIIEIDTAAQRLGYFHGQGYYHLHGSDFVNAFRLGGHSSPEMLPPFVEFIKRRTSGEQSAEALLNGSLSLLQRQLNYLPETNPFEKFKPRFAADLKWLADAPMEVFHQYSFATLRQFGACYELATTYLQWLQSHEIPDLEVPIAAFKKLSTSAKSMQFQLARAMMRKKPLDLATIDDMASTWQTAMDHLKARVPLIACEAGTI